MALIDLCAAVCAVKHSRRPCVTAGIEAVHFLSPARINQLVILQATIAQAFNTSVQVMVSVYAEDLKTGEQTLCCTAVLVFVALDEQGNKTRVPALELVPGDSKLAFIAQAKEAVEIKRDLGTKDELDDGSVEKVLMKDTAEEMTKLVMPANSNSLGFTFGGQILKWMEQSGSISAMKVARSDVATASMDGMSFKKSSKSGWMLQFRSRVTRVFGRSIEVQVQVAGNDYRGLRNEITIAEGFFTFVSLDSKNLSKQITPSNSEEKQQFDNAIERRRKRLAILENVRQLVQDKRLG